MSQRATGVEARAGKAKRVSSDVPIWLMLAIGVPAYLLAVQAAREAPTYVHDLLLERGWVSHAVMLATTTALAALLVKAIALVWQRAAFRAELVSRDMPTISAQTVDQAIDHVMLLRDSTGSTGFRRRFLFERALRMLEHFRARNDVTETAAVGSAESDADSNAVAASFSLLKVIIWAIPILGFIGTVIGISDAMAAFSQALTNAEQLDTIKVALRGVTIGLAVAFDNTLVALVASILVMVPTSRVQQAEERLIDDVDEACSTKVLRALSLGNAEPVAAAAPAHPAGVEDLRAAVAELVMPAITTLIDANAKLMARLSDDRELLRETQVALRDQLGAFAVATRHLGPSVERAVATLAEISQPMRAQHGHANGHTNGHTNGHANGHVNGHAQNGHAQLGHAEVEALGPVSSPRES